MSKLRKTGTGGRGLCRYLYMLLIVLVSVSPAVAQDADGRIRGTVAAIDGSVLPGVTVTATEGTTNFERMAVTGPNGGFEIGPLPAGRYLVRASLSGFADFTREVTLTRGETETVRVVLSAGAAETVTVTGSLIPRPTLDALSPVAVMGVEEITYSGVTRIEDLMQTLPQAFVGQNSTWANGATGTATVSLRNLGSARTLVLLNGRRLAPGDPFTPSAADLNFIPAALIERVDVLTGGASSVYGADAVAGVVNFILDTDFEGFRGGVQYSMYQHDNSNAIAQQINQAVGFDVPTGSSTDGYGINANIAWGGKFAEGRGHATAFVGYRELDAITKSARDYLNCSVAAGPNGPRCGGSSTSAEGRFIAFGKEGNFLGDFILDWSGEGNTFRRYGGELFNYGPFNHIQRPDERWNAGAFLNYDINPRAKGYASVMFMDDSTNAQIAPSGNFAVVNRVNCDNPLLSEQQREAICVAGGYDETDFADVFILRRNVEGGERNEDLSHTSYRLVAGIGGDILDGWTYDFSGNQSETRGQFAYNNDLNVNRMRQALDVITDPNTGQPICRDAAARAAGCVPWNIFQRGAVDPRALDYMSTSAIGTGTTRTQVANLTFTGDLERYGLTIPTATEGLGLAVGAEWREETLVYRPDEVYEFGLAAGFGGGSPPISGSFDVVDVFMEALVPIVQDVTGFRDLSLELGYRHSDYSTSGGADTYKAMMSYAPTADFKFRGGFNRAIRSANIFELFESQNFGLGGSEDICANDPATGVPSASLEECMRTGVTREQYGNILPNPADQYNTLGGGNPNLSPEEADTLTFGLVLTPARLPGLALAFDYYNIEIDKAIGSLSADDIIQTCARTGDAALCSLIHRDAQGTLWLTQEGYTETTEQNIGLITAEGVDVSASYPVSMGRGGVLQTDLTGSYLLDTTFANPLVNYNCAGFYGPQCGQTNADWRHRLRLSWQMPVNTTLSLVWRHIGSAEIDDASSDPDIGNPNAMERHRINNVAVVPAFDWFDLALGYDLTQNIQFAVGVNNLLDEEPPLFPGLADNPAVNTYAIYDPLGRYLHASLRFNY